ncbi:Electron transport complex, RnfABCDGE type, D subunit [uncultured Desulfatiglans sp.]|uniref:Electron transport complex, RnfABCDGE type, D subunit n=1 Tax=Uncultured Desulfatiglans sp. TaxID=1748965 RepID=A0A653ABM5_UNCDX|nr:Electron transport complex, RnfABCDGE type, D subunit [uncultured Desulfatiglans sp.]
MLNQKLLVGSHAPFWHNGSSLYSKNANIMLAALPAVAMGIYQYGIPALAVLTLSVASAMIWEWLFNLAARRPVSIGDLDAAVIGLIFGMLLPAGVAWWVVIIGSFAAVVIGKMIFGGVGCNPLNPPLVGLAILMLSWKSLVEFNAALVDYNLGFNMIYPLSAIKFLGAGAAADYDVTGFLMAGQSGAIGATFGLGLIIGGVYLILRGFIRWEIAVSFLVGVFLSALLFNLSDAEKYAPPLFHLLTGYTLIGAFFLATEDSSSPINFVPMLIYGLAGGVMTVLIRNIGAFVDGVVFAVLLLNAANPLLDKIRPKAMGRDIQNA